MYGSKLEPRSNNAALLVHVNNQYEQHFLKKNPQENTKIEIN